MMNRSNSDTISRGVRSVMIFLLGEIR